MPLYGGDTYGSGPYGMAGVNVSIQWKTEIALGSDPRTLVADQTWVDVSDYVLESHTATLHHGRADENSQIQASTLTLTLDNSAGYFTVGYGGSPYGATLDIGVMIRRTAIVSGTEYPRFTGYIDDLTIPEWANSPFEKVVTAIASDRLARIGSEHSGTMLSMLSYETLSAGAGIYWPLSEEAGAQFAVPLTATETAPLTVVGAAGTVSWSGGTGVPTDALNSVQLEPSVDDNGNLIAAGDYLVSRLTGYTYGGTNSLAMSAWVTLTTLWSSTAPYPNVVNVNATDFRMRIFVDLSTGRICGEIMNLPATGSATVVGPVAALGKLYNVVLSATQGQVLALYVNGQTYFSSGNIPSIGTKTPTAVTIGGPLSGSVGHVALFHKALYIDDVAKLFAAGTIGTNGMLADDALTLIAGYAGIDPLDLSFTSPAGYPGRALTTVDNIPLYGRSRADVLLEIARIEDGLLFVDGAGTFRFHARGTRWNVTSPQYTFTTDELKDTFPIPYNNQFVVNECRVKRSDGVTARALDLTSQARRGIYAEEIEERFGSDYEPASRALYRVNTFKVPLPRVGQLVTDITTSQTQDAILGLEIGSLISLTGLSDDQPNISNQWIEGWDESQSVDDYVITFTTSPQWPTQQQPYFQVGAGTYARLGLAPLAP